MHKATRTQNDDLGDHYTVATGTDFSEDTPENKDMARQEFKDDADINNLLKRFGVDNQQRTVTQFGDADFTIDLQQAMHSVNDAQRAYSRMNPDIKKLYPTFDRFLRGMNSGDLAKDLQRLNDEKIPVQQTAEIRAQMARENRRLELERDDEAARIAADFKAGKVSPKKDDASK